MALDNNAKVGDIITALNCVQGLNQKAELVSGVHNMTSYENEVKEDMINKINAVSTENFLNLPSNTNWYDIASAIPNIKTGKRLVPGITPVVNGFIEVNNLDFMPLIVIGKRTVGNATNAVFFLYADMIPFGGAGEISIIQGTNMNPPAVSLYTRTNTGFKVSVTGTENGYSYAWIAIG